MYIYAVIIIHNGRFRFLSSMCRLKRRKAELSANSGKATKRLGRLEQNLAHMCKFIWELIYDKQTNCPSRHKGALGGFYGVNNSKVLGRCPIGTNFGSRLCIHLEMDIG